MSISPIVIHPMNNGYINSLTPTINGTGEPGATINATLNNVNYTAQVKENGTWAIEVQNPLTEGATYQLSVQQTNQSNVMMGASAVSFQANPGLMAAHSVASPQANQYVNTATPTVQGTGKAGATINVAIGNEKYSTVVNADGSWSVMLSRPLAQGVNTVSATQTDMGNISPAAQVSFLVDSIAPAEPVVSAPVDMSVVKTPKPVISGQGEPGANIDATVDDRNYSTVANASGAWSMEVSEALGDADHVLSVKQRDAANNISPAKVLLFTVDTQLPEAPTVQSPANNQFISTAMPVIKGSGDAGNEIQAVYAGKMYTSTVDQDGSWQVKITDRLPEGNQTVKLYQVDKAGNVSMPTDLLLRIDTSIPPMPAVLFPMQNGFVNATPFSINGTGEPDATVIIQVAGRNLTAQVNRDGCWSINIDLPNKHAYTASISQQDAAGNHGPSAELKFNVDTGSLNAPGVTYPAQGSFINTDIPVVGGKARPGATVHVGIGDATHTVAADDQGNWVLQPGQLGHGLQSLRVWQNVMGNTSPQTSVSFQVKTKAPAAPTVLQPGDQTQVNGWQIGISGTAEPNATLDIHVDTQTLSATADAGGAWSVAPPGVLPNGTHAILARQTDRAGNIGPFAEISFQSTGQPTAAATQDALPVVAQITCNPSGPQWINKTIAVLTANKPIMVNGSQGTCFARVIAFNGLHRFEYTDLAGTAYTAVVGVDWLDDIPPVIDITSGGNGGYFSADKTVHFYKHGPSGVKSSLLNGASFISGITVNAEGYYTVEVRDHAGNISTRDFVIDRSSPTITGVSSGMTASTDVTLGYYDTICGIKSATLNGNPFSPGTVVNANGSYNVSVTDNAGNSVQFDFQVQKP